MIQQRPGDLLEIKIDSAFFYVVVLTNIVQFGGNIVFAFHTDGSRRMVSEFDPKKSGFNVCTDLLKSYDRTVPVRPGLTFYN